MFDAFNRCHCCGCCCDCCSENRVGPADEDGERADVQDSAAQTDGNDRSESAVAAAAPAVVYICEPLVPTTYAKPVTETFAASSATTSTMTTERWRQSVARTEDERIHQPVAAIASKPSRIQRYTGRTIKVAPSTEATDPDPGVTRREAPSQDADDNHPQTTRRETAAAVPVAATSTSSSSKTTVEDLALMLPDLPEGESASNAKPAYVSWIFLHPQRGYTPVCYSNPLP
jgi:hypothetical protein